MVFSIKDWISVKRNSACSSIFTATAKLRFNCSTSLGKRTLSMLSWCISMEIPEEESCIRRYMSMEAAVISSERNPRSSEENEEAIFDNETKRDVDNITDVPGCWLCCLHRRYCIDLFSQS